MICFLLLSLLLSTAEDCVLDPEIEATQFEAIWHWPPKEHEHNVMWTALGWWRLGRVPLLQVSHSSAPICNSFGHFHSPMLPTCLNDLNEDAGGA